jgi:hypothetical protein
VRIIIYNVVEIVILLRCATGPDVVEYSVFQLICVNYSVNNDI